MTAEHSYYFATHPASTNSKMDISDQSQSEYSMSMKNPNRSHESKSAEYIYSQDATKDKKELGVFKDLLIRDGCEKYLKDLQNLLIETCFIKLKIIYPAMVVDKDLQIQEPVPFYYCGKLPLVMCRLVENEDPRIRLRIFSV